MSDLVLTYYLLHFTPGKPEGGRPVWTVHRRAGNLSLGVIAWAEPQQQFCYFSILPIPYNGDLLAELHAFLKQLRSGEGE